MPERKGSHLDYDDRCAIEEGIEAGLSASAIARRLGVSASTVTREVKANRSCRVPKRSGDVPPAKKCGNYMGCERWGTACRSCPRPGRPHRCRLCKEAVCCDECPDFEPRDCPRTGTWPYVCGCGEEARSRCPLPKWRYRARAADESSLGRLSESRRGISVSDEELEAMLGIVRPLISSGLSPEAIWAEHGRELPVCSRTFYAWMEDGRLDIPAILLPRKVRCRGRKSGKKAPDPERYRGRTYADFLSLPAEARASAAEVDSVIGYAHNRSRALSVLFARMSFQVYLRLPDASPGAVVAAFDHLEMALGSCGLFRLAMGVVLLDRGEEFGDVGGMERSRLSPGEKRCRVYFCDPMSPGQKGRCERGHAEMRRILPKGRSDFDLMSAADWATVTSHVASYPRKSLNGRCPIDLAEMLLPEGFLEHLGIGKVPRREVVLRPSLMPHAVRR